MKIPPLYRWILASLLGCDLFAIGLGLITAWTIPGNVPFLPSVPYIRIVVISFSISLVFCWLTIIKLLQGYDLRDVAAGTREYRTVINAALVTGGLTGAALYLGDVPLSRTFFFVSIISGTGYMLAGRYWLRRLIHKTRRNGHFMRRTLLIGSPTRITSVAEALLSRTWLGLQPIGGFIATAFDETTSSPEELAKNIRETIHLSQAEVVLLTDGELSDSQSFARIMWILESLNVSLIVMPTFSNVATDRIHMRPVSGLPFVWVERPRSAEALSWGKRTFDIIIASLGGLAISPLLLTIALAIKLSDGGPIFFRQIRVGHNGEHFNLLKFRSMVPDAEARQAELLAHSDGNERLFKMKSDPRVTRIGRFLRKHSLDELPQLWNVLRGDMSLVGPRPALPNEAALYSFDEGMRLRVRPGMTGLWQVSGRSSLNWQETIRLDLYYVDNWSMLRDITILFRTAHTVISGSGAY